MQLSNNIVPKRDYGFNGTNRLAAYALLALTGSTASAAMYDENMRSLGAMRSLKGANQSFADVIDFNLGASTNGGSSVSFLGSSQTTASQAGSGATSNWLNSTNANGEFSNAMVDVFSNGIIESAQSRGDTADCKHFLNTCTISSDHPDKSFMLLLNDGYIRAVSRLYGQPKYSKAGTADFKIPTTDAANIASMKGSASYNFSRKELTVLSWKTGTTFDVLTYGGVDFEKYPSPNQALTAAGVTLTKSTVLLQQVLSTSLESIYKVNPVVTSDGTVFVSGMIPNSKLWLDKFTRSGTTQITSANQTSVSTYTTTYGLETGIAYGQRQITSRDGQAVACFCPYYYYGSGLAGFIIDKLNNTYFTLNQTLDTANGISIVPFKDNGFALQTNGNSWASNPAGAKITTYERGGGLATDTTFRVTGDNKFLPYFPNANGSANYPVLIPVLDYAMLVRDKSTGELFLPYGDSF